jgi:signal peptidase I
MPPNHHEPTHVDSRDNLVTRWYEATFRPRAFFSKSPDKRSGRHPIVFAVGVSVITTMIAFLVAALFTEGAFDAAALIGALAFGAIGTIVSVYFSSAVVHTLLRIVGMGKPARPTNAQFAPEKSAASNADARYAPPTVVDVGEKAVLGPFSDTLHVVGYTHGPLLVGAIGAPGQLIGSIWSFVILIIGLSCVHRISIWRSFGVIFTVLTGPIILALTLRIGVIEAFKIPSGAMIPTLMIGDHIFVSKFAYGPLLPNSDARLFSRLPPARGDVMVFKFPENKAQDFIKRAIAIPGDTLEAINGRPIINGWLVPHCYVGKFGRNQDRLYVEFLEDKSFLTLYAQDAMQGDGPDKPACKVQDDCGLGQTCRAGICGHHQGPFKVRPNEVWVMGDNRLNSHDSRTWRGGQGAGVPFENIKGRAMFVWMSFDPNGGVASDRLFVQIMGPPTIPGKPDEALQSALDKCLRERPDLAKTTPPLPK